MAVRWRLRRLCPRAARLIADPRRDVGAYASVSLAVPVGLVQVALQASPPDDGGAAVLAV